ncbi:helix-turn-helix domain-containing protein [Patescibacteria group bacterium]|nr:helix-turn-helix domain-containing protein [Patescibacteria group bacterium]
MFDQVRAFPKHRKAIDRHIGKQIAEARQVLGMSEQTLADAVGLSPAALLSIEQGRARITALYLFDVAAHLNKSLGYFYGMTEVTTERIKDRMLATEEEWLLAKVRTLSEKQREVLRRLLEVLQ